MQTRLKDYYSPSDCRMLRRLFVRRIKELTKDGLPVHLLLSGGVDSVTILFALMEAGIPFQAHTFSFKDVPSSDLDTVKQIRQHLSYEQVYHEFPSDWEHLCDEVKASVALCRETYGRIREVKVETMLAYRMLRAELPQEPILVINGNQCVLMYTRNDALWIAKVGEYSPEVNDARRGKMKDAADEETVIFDNIVSPYIGGCVEDFLCRFTVSACHYPKPKAILYYAFEDYYKRCGCYRKPRPFQKASNEKALFNNIATSLGYKGALDLFKAVEQDER